MLGNKEVLNISIEDIIPNRFQPRLAFGEKELNELADSIKQHGIISPLLVRRIGEKYEIIAGERRYKAATIAGLNNVPAILIETDDNTSAEIAIIENIQRKDLTAIEEAQSYKKLIEKGNTQETIAKKLGIAQSTVANKLRLLSLSEDVQESLLNNKISERHARSLLKLTDLEEQKNLLNKIINEKLTVKQTDEEIEKMLNILTLSNNNLESIENFEEITKNTSLNNPKIVEKEDIDFLTPFSEPNFKQELVTPIEEFNSPKIEKPIIDFDSFNEKPIIIEEDNLKNFVIAINKVRNFINNLDEEGYKVSTEEFDFEDMYQIVIKIKKD